MHGGVLQMKHLFLFLNLFGVLFFLTVVPITVTADQAKLKPLYNSEELIFCNQIFRGNYLIVTRKHDPTTDPESRYKFRYVVHSKGTYKVALVKELGQGIYSHIVSGTLTQENRDRTNNRKVSQDSDLFIWIEGQASNTYLFHATESGIVILFEGGEFRAHYSCQDVDGDGIYEILQYDSTWHAMGDERKKWAKQMNGHPFAKLIYKFDGSKYVLSEIVPDYEAEKER